MSVNLLLTVRILPNLTFLCFSAQSYNLFQKHNPDQFEEGSPKWHMAMIKYLMDMKNNGHKIHEVVMDKVTVKNKDL